MAFLHSRNHHQGTSRSVRDSVDIFLSDFLRVTWQDCFVWLCLPLSIVVLCLFALTCFLLINYPYYTCCLLLFYKKLEYRKSDYTNYSHIGQMVKQGLVAHNSMHKTVSINIQNKQVPSKDILYNMTVEKETSNVNKEYYNKVPCSEGTHNRDFHFKVRFR